MPPRIAAFLTIIFILFLFRRESRKNGKVSGALWLPVMWMAITGTRFVGQWLSLSNFNDDGIGTEGSTIDALYFLTLIITGIYVLNQRQILLSKIVKENRWLSYFFIYCFISIAWSDFPFIAFKRYIKILGHPIMALIIITDPNPQDALRIVMKRCAFLMMPLSVLFIKYYPEYGRYFDQWTGQAYNSGVTLNKNELGYGCMLFGIFFFWNFLAAFRIENWRKKVDEILLSLLFLFMIGWLWYMAQSATSLATFLIGVATIFILSLRIINKKFIGTYFIVTIIFAVLADSSFNIYEKIVELLGRDPTLTDRTEVWEDALALVSNPVLGMGFESFWLGQRLTILWSKWWWQPNQSHNGYIETYLNLGAVGVFLLFGILISTFRKISKQLIVEFNFSRLRLGFLFAIIFYNYTEAAFKAVHLVWTVFHIIAIDYSKPITSKSKKPSSR
ncbi:MAG TPA: O-antigen ligase family protein [Candidatus Competibacter sp.]|nr:O-antigen ligase family protein [Candidatus Competibacter sp.]